jgi:hypothetical protein
VIGFGAGSVGAGFFSDPGDPLPPRGHPRDHATDLLGSAGLEGRWRTGAWSFSTSLLALVPLLSSYADDFEVLDGLTSPRSGARLGAELRLGAWFEGSADVRTPRCPNVLGGRCGYRRRVSSRRVDGRFR